jgi:hypothetical protein
MYISINENKCRQKCVLNEAYETDRFKHEKEFIDIDSRSDRRDRAAAKCSAIESATCAL